MISRSELSEWADRIISNLGDTTLSNCLVVSWFQNNLYKINLGIGTSFELSGEDNYIVPSMTQIQSGIYEELYYCDYLKKRSISSMGAGSYDWVEIDGDKQGKVRVISKNDTSKNYQNMAKEQCSSVAKLIEEYNTTVASGRTAFQILYNERGNAAYDGIDDFQYSQYFSRYNTVFNE